MKQSIFIKYIIAYFAFALIGFLLITHLTTNQTFNQIREFKVTAFQSSAKSIAKSLSTNENLDGSNYFEAIGNFTESLDATTWVVAPNGAILYSTDASEDVARIPNFNISYFKNKDFAIGHLNGVFDSTYLSVYHPVIIGKDAVAYVLINMPTSIILTETILQVNIFYITYFLILLLAMIFIYIFVSNVYAPLRKIRIATKEYAKGNFSYPLKTGYNEEFDELAHSLNYMAHQLNSAEEYQRKFVSNISHDFRSPLTSIKGYVGAIMDGTIPSEMQNKYLGIVLSEAERLERLSDGLIDLNRWGTTKIGIIFEDFNLIKVIVNVMDSLEGRCKAKDINFDFHYDEQYNVSADKDKIEQVIHNLIDNAIKFSPTESTISIKLYTKGDKVFCSIKDSGIGISKKDLPRIWDRFYKTDLSRGKDRTGSGIGLSIVKEIITAHGENIDVISTEMVGTEFVFSLKKSKKQK